MTREQNDLPAPFYKIALRQCGLMNRQQLIDTGCSPHRIRQRVADGVWRRCARGVYNVLPQHPWPDPYDAARRRSAWLGILAVPGSIATGVSALALHGIWGLPQLLHPEVAVSDGAYRRGRREVRIRREQNFATVAFHGHRIAAPTEAFAQALPDLSRNHAVATLDSALNRRVIPPAAMSEISAKLKGRTGADRARGFLALANPLAQSPFESLTRLQCLDAGLPEPQLQVKVWDENARTIAHGDLGWERTDGTWVLVDLDGRRYHEDPQALLVDRRRQNAIALSGRHTHLRFAWEDLRTGAIPRAIRKALRVSAVAS